MLVKTYCGAVRGIVATKITIEVNVTQGIRFFIVGLADHAIRESQQRIESALTHNEFGWPRYRVVINLAPADIKKEGTHFDLPLAIGILAATKQVNVSMLEEFLLLGELSLDGKVMPVRGVLPMVLMAREEGFRGVLVPERNVIEASAVDGIEVVPVADLGSAVSFLNGELQVVRDRSSVNSRFVDLGEEVYDVDFAEVRGQEAVKRAMLIAAAGNHNLLLIGAPGSGKSMLARRLPTIMPPMTLDESLQTTIIHSVAGRVDPDEGLVRQRPFRTPHHSSSHIALIGGGSSPQPGEVSLAHNGILFLDELPEFQRHVLEVLRQPLEEREIRVSRAGYRVVYPSNFLLVTAMNPCPCGYYSHPEKECNCGPGIIKRYLSRISGPLLDRIDMHMEVVPVPYSELSKRADAERSEVIRKRVITARTIQQQRFGSVQEVYSNAQMGPSLRKQFCTLDSRGHAILRNAMESLRLSARGYDRILKVARTIADLEGEERIHPSHLSEAVHYRNLDREGWSG
ncbi:MAG: YifB family Mg chelatase-like AAA ATPase [Bacteroidota bacterium]